MIDFWFTRYKRRHNFLLVIFISYICLGCTFSLMKKYKPNRCWLYQIQKAEPDKIIKSGFDIVIMDYSFDGTEKNKYRASDIETMKNVLITPIAYLSIGEAETYRYYWHPEWEKNKPEWLGQKNPEFEDNYKVKYWHPEWQAIIRSYIDKIIEQGFSGVYLDIVDGFEYWSDEANPDYCLTEPEAAARMIDFVKRLAEYSREKRGKDFKIFPQNGERILDYDSDGSYLNFISGIGVEDIWHDGTTAKSKSEIEEKVSYLDKFVQVNKIVLAVDYIDDGSGYKGENKNRIDNFVNNCKAYEFYFYIANVDRNLDSINRIKNRQP